MALIGGAVLLAACGRPPGPQGWAPARAVQVDSQQLVLVPHKSKLYALPNASSNAAWQFPPKDKTAYPVSAERTQALLEAIADLDPGVRQALTPRIADLRLSGPSRQALKDAIDASAPQDQRSRLKSLVDRTLTVENDALKNLKAIYGDIGLSADGKTAYVGTFRGMLFALDTTNGNMRWARDAGSGLVGGIAVDSGVLYFGTKGGSVYAFDAATAEQQWQFDADGEVWATPTVDGDTVYATSLDGSVYALDKSSGKRNWQFSGASSGIAARPVVARGTVYVGAFDNRMYALSADSGAMQWSFKGGNWFWSTPVVADGVVYAAGLDGKVYAVNAPDGSERWSRDLGSAVRSAPVLAGDGLVVAAKDGRVYKLDLASGQDGEGSPVITGETVLADLTADDKQQVYVVPTSAELLVFDASGALSPPGGVPLPQ